MLPVHRLYGLSHRLRVPRPLRDLLPHHRSLFNRVHLSIDLGLCDRPLYLHLRAVFSVWAVYEVEGQQKRTGCGLRCWHYPRFCGPRAHSHHRELRQGGYWLSLNHQKHCLDNGLPDYHHLGWSHAQIHQLLHGQRSQPNLAARIARIGRYLAARITRLAARIERAG